MTDHRRFLHLALGQGLRVVTWLWAWVCAEGVYDM